MMYARVFVATLADMHLPRRDANKTLINVLANIQVPWGAPPVNMHLPFGIRTKQQCNPSEPYYGLHVSV